MKDFLRKDLVRKLDLNPFSIPPYSPDDIRKIYSNTYCRCCMFSKLYRPLHKGRDVLLKCGSKRYNPGDRDIPLTSKNDVMIATSVGPMCCDCFTIFSSYFDVDRCSECYLNYFFTNENSYLFIKDFVNMMPIQDEDYERKISFKSRDTYSRQSLEMFVILSIIYPYYSNQLMYNTPYENYFFSAETSRVEFRASRNNIKLSSTDSDNDNSIEKDDYEIKNEDKLYFKFYDVLTDNTMKTIWKKMNKIVYNKEKIRSDYIRKVGDYKICECCEPSSKNKKDITSLNVSNRVFYNEEINIKVDPETVAILDNMFDW